MHFYKLLFFQNLSKINKTLRKRHLYRSCFQKHYNNFCQMQFWNKEVNFKLIYSICFLKSGKQSETHFRRKQFQNKEINLKFFFILNIVIFPNIFQKSIRSLENPICLEVDTNFCQMQF